MLSNIPFKKITFLYWHDGFEVLELHVMNVSAVLKEPNTGLIVRVKVTLTVGKLIT